MSLRCVILHIYNHSTMNIKLRAFGVARDIIGSPVLEIDESTLGTTGEVKAYLIENYPKFADLLTFSLAVKDEYQEDDFVLSDHDEVIIIPPVSGG